MVLRLRGMISTFTTTAAGEVRPNERIVLDFLMSGAEAPPANRRVRQRLHAALREVARASGTPVPSLTPGRYVSEARCERIAPVQLRAVAAFLDHLVARHPRHNGDGSRSHDHKFNLDEARLASVLGHVGDRLPDVGAFAPAAVAAKLRALFPNGGSNAKFALRHTRGPTDACIAFHCDGGYATYTVQLTLAEGPAGGRLCFFDHAGLHVQTRRAGSWTAHPCDVWHGVTRLVGAGVRRSLFVLDRSNGLGEHEIHDVDDEDVTTFCFADPPPTGLREDQICVICKQYPRQYAALPCHHLHYCDACIALLPEGRCATCQAATEGYVRVYS